MLTFLRIVGNGDDSTIDQIVGVAFERIFDRVLDLIIVAIVEDNVSPILKKIQDAFDVIERALVAVVSVNEGEIKST